MFRWRYRDVLLVTGFVFTFSASLCHAGWNITQLTDNDYHDATPYILGDKIVWCANVAGSQRSDREIMLYDGQNVTQVTENFYEDRAPRISGDGVCWQSKPDGDWEISYYTSGVISQLTVNNIDDVSPEIAGQRVAWHGGNGQDSEIYLYDGLTVTQLTNNDETDTYPMISSDSIVWAGRCGGKEEIFVHHADVTTRLTTNDVADVSPSLGDNVLFWRRMIETTDNGMLGQIILYDGDETSLTDDIPGILDHQAPAVFGRRAAWSCRDLEKIYTDLEKSNQDIFYFDGTVVQRLTNDEYNDDDPVISEYLVVWSGYDGHDDEIFVYDGKNFEQLTDNEYDDTSPCVNGRNIAWVGYADEGAGGDGEIFLAAHTPEPGAAVMLLFGIGWLTRRASARTIRRSYDHTHCRHG
jgi:hypothetical protein